MLINDFHCICLAVKKTCVVCTLSIVVMALETAGRGTLIILVVLCLDLQGDAQPLELNFEVGAVFSCKPFHAFLACC